MNKKGFTLIEVIVSIVLLAIIGVVIGISLNKTLKNRNEISYSEFVEKVKSSAMLYVNNTSDIINSLNEVSFKIIKVKDLIDNGYLKENTQNPDTGEKINLSDKVKVSYNSDKELTIEYPYNDDYKEPYLYALNYITTYKSAESDICYKGLNTPSLQLINENGVKVHNLLKDVSIIAYMEDGTLCTYEKINTSKIGTYKIRYDYTPDASNISTSDNVKSADRTITINPSKPVINVFKVSPTDSNNVYNAKMDLEVSDASGLKLKYCIVGYSSSESNNISSKDLINKCSDTPKIVNGVTQLNNVWKDLNYSSSKDKYEDTKNFDISTEMSEFKDNSEVIFYVIVKNSFEEYNSKNNEYNNGIYNLSRIVTLNANGGKFSDNQTNVTFKVRYNSTFKEMMDNNSKYKTPTSSSSYVFEGWTNNGQTYLNTSDFKITKDMEFSAMWYQYCSTKIYTGESSCSASCGGGTKTIYYKDSKYSNRSCNESRTCNTQACTTKPSSGDGGSSGISCINGSERTGKYCDCSDYGPPTYVGIYAKSWVDGNGQTRCCCGN